MKFTVAKSDLETALKVVSNTKGPGSGGDILSHVVFRHREDDEGGFIEVLTTNGRIFSCARVQATQIESVEVPAFTVEFQRLIGNRGWLDAVAETSLTFEFDSESKIVVGTSPRGKMKFQSCDPEDFPYWDDTQAAAKHTNTVEGGVLIEALKYIKDFISNDESGNPQLCVTEFRDGGFYATNKISAAVAKIKDFGESNLRIHGKDLGPLLGFLALAESDEEFEIWEHDRAAFFIHPLGHVFGESRFHAKFRQIELDPDYDHTFLWELDPEEVTEGVRWLIPCADVSDSRIRFSAIDGENTNLSMVSTSGENTSLPIPVRQIFQDEKNKDVFDSPKGFTVSYTSLLKTLAAYPDGEAVQMGINPQGRGGWLGFRRETENVLYMTVLIWVIE